MGANTSDMSEPDPVGRLVANGAKPGDETSDSLAEQTVSGLLEMIVNLAVAGVEGMSGASISLLVRDGEQLDRLRQFPDRP